MPVYGQRMTIPVTVQEVEIPVDQIDSDENAIHLEDYSSVGEHVTSQIEIQSEQLVLSSIPGLENYYVQSVEAGADVDEVSAVEIAPTSDKKTSENFKVVSVIKSTGSSNVDLNKSKVGVILDNVRQSRRRGPRSGMCGTTSSDAEAASLSDEGAQSSTNSAKSSYLRKKRRRVIIDQVKAIPVSEFKAQLNDVSDIIRPIELAPARSRSLKYYNTKGVGKLFAYPGKSIQSDRVFKHFEKQLTSVKQECKPLEDMKLLPIGYKPQIDPSKIKRITRRRRYPEAEEYQRRMSQQQMQETFDNLVAESQKNMEAVFLENTGTLVDDESGNLRVLIQAAENDAVGSDASERVDTMYATAGDELGDGREIVLIGSRKEGEDGAMMQRKIELLLAAAESREQGMELQPLYICDSSFDGAEGQLFMSQDDHQIYVVQNVVDDDDGQTETVVTS
ncbi:double-strand-break repair protein rad21 homolog A-like isoform X2 [Ischnura elegans]|nr:double-strand-break repair protein rad21 homolog A-like isoform X2 [Ischnura elegans]